MHQGIAARLLLAVALQSPLMGVVADVQLPPSSTPTGAVLAELDTETNDYDRVLTACITSDASASKQAQIDALQLVWGYVFPTTTWKLNNNSALELLKLAGGAQSVLLYLEEFKDREGIQWPLAFSKAMIQKKAAETGDGDITGSIREALQLAERQGDGYKDFRRYIARTKEGSEEG